MAYNADPEQRYVKAMGSDLGRVFAQLFQECAWVHTKWAEFVALYASAPAEVALLNSVAPRFFRLVHDTLWEDVLLHICRLTDKPEVGHRRRKETLSLQSLPRLVRPDLQGEVRRRVSIAVQRADFARDWRDRYIAHRSLELALRTESAKSLEPATEKTTRQALDSIAAVLNFLEQEYCGSLPVMYNFDQGADAERLLYVLRRHGVVQSTQVGFN